MSGWIKVHRSILEWEWYSDVNARLLFLHLLLTVNYTEGKWQGKTINRGQRVTSLPKLAEETGLSIQQARTALDKLKLTGELTDKNFNRGRIITILRFDEYQGDNSQDNRQITGKQQTNQQTDNSNIRNKEIKKERKKEVNKTNLSANADVNAIFEYWKNVFGKRENTVLSTKRKRSIERSLKNYTVEQLQCAILGCSKSDYHVEGGYTDIELICREPEKTDKFIHLNQPKVVKRDSWDDALDGFLNDSEPSPFGSRPRIVGGDF